MKISVFGLGYVGAVSCACFSKNGHDVIGVDVNEKKVAMINDGKSPIIEQDLEEYIQEGISSGKLRAVTDAGEAIQNSELSLICVGTPSQDNGNIDLSYILKVCERIGGHLKEKEGFHTIVIRSTVVPGTIKTCGELLEKVSGKKLNEDFGIAANPEFLREGSSIYDFYNPPYTIIGASGPQTEDVVEQLYSDIDAKVFKLKPEEAEMIKYTNNNFHALKITFANEIGNICKELGVDGHKVMDIVAKDKKLNLSPYYLKPGFAFGGSCLPKDVRGLNYKARSLDLESPLLNSLLESNEQQIQRAMQLIKKTGKKRITMLGFAFKAGTDDLRESPMVTLIETMIGKGYEVKVFDSNVKLSQLLGKNKDYLVEHIPHIANLMQDTMQEAIKDAEVIVVGNSSEEFAALFDMVTEDQIIIDLVRIDAEKVSSNNYVGICW